MGIPVVSVTAATRMEGPMQSFGGSVSNAFRRVTYQAPHLEEAQFMWRSWWRFESYRTDCLFIRTEESTLTNLFHSALPRRRKASAKNIFRTRQGNRRRQHLLISAIIPADVCASGIHVAQTGPAISEEFLARQIENEFMRAYCLDCQGSSQRTKKVNINVANEANESFCRSLHLDGQRR